MSVPWDDGRRYCGRVADTRVELTDVGHAVASFQVLYDDGERRWYREDDLDDLQLRLEDEGRWVEGWERLELTCAISLQRLVDPAKGSSCAHPSKCNFETLRAHVARSKACPIVGCDARFQRRHDVQRDDRLARQLASVAPAVRAVWTRAGEILTKRPESQSATLVLLDDD